MIKVVCRTNLDLHLAETWPGELPAVPRVGDLIESAYSHNGFRLSLEVTSVTWRLWTKGEYLPVIELHFSNLHRNLYPKDDHDGTVAKGSVTAFYQWYAPLVGKSVGSFI